MPGRIEPAWHGDCISPFVPTMALRHSAAILVLCLASPSPAGAADVAVRYLVERTPLRASAATTPVTVELHADATCSAPFASATLPLGDLQPLVDLQRVKLRGARPAPRVVELRPTVSGAPAVATIYARVHGDGITPVGGACQVQAFVPPPSVTQPIARDATGAVIGALSLISYPEPGGAQTAVLRDDGYGAYGLAIGSMIFASLDIGLVFPTTDCSGAPFLQRFGVLMPTSRFDDSEVFHGPGGPPSIITVRSALGLETDDCFEDTTPGDRLAVPAIPLGLERFVPPFRIDHEGSRP